VLSRSLAGKNHYPAIDVLNSASRLMKEIVSDNQYDNAGRFRDLLATYNEAEDLINIGAYVKGSNPRIDESLAKINDMNGFLKQRINESFSLEQSAEMINKIVGTA
jgi:flagellum-specific ATP synthase